MNTLEVRPSRAHSRMGPLRYPGGKGALTGFFERVLEGLDLRDATYVEPFAGGAGAAVALLRRGTIARVHINDLDPAVHSFWISITQDTARFVDAIATVPLTLDEWGHQRQIYQRADESDPFALGFAFFYLNRTNRSGILNAGVIGGKAQSGTYRIDARFNRDDLAARVSAIGALRDQIQLSARDGRRVIADYEGRTDVLMYVDPPYVEMGGTLYLNALRAQDHVDLASTLTKSGPVAWILTYDDHKLIRELYKRQHLYAYELFYSARNPGKKVELMALSDSVATALERSAS